MNDHLQPIKLAEKFSKISQFWTPGIIAELNDQYVKLAKVKGEFVWHTHEHEDELFLVMKGLLTVHFRGRRAIEIGPGELLVVPRGVEHRPVAREETHVVVFEPKSTAHTGDVRCELTVQETRLDLTVELAICQILCDGSNSVSCESQHALG